MGGVSGVSRLRGPMIDERALDAAVRRCRLLLYIARKYGPDSRRCIEFSWTMKPLIVGYYHEAIDR